MLPVCIRQNTVPTRSSRCELLHLLGDRVGATGDHDARLDEVLPRQLLEPLHRLLPELAELARLQGLERAVAGRVGEARVHVQAVVEEVEDVLGVQPLGLLVGVGHRDDLGEAGAVRVDRRVAALRATLPEPVEQ